jgi:hypothetical protein
MEEEETIMAGDGSGASGPGAQSGVVKDWRSGPRRVNRRQFTRRGGNEELPTWWLGMVAVHTRLARAEAELEAARRDRYLAVWLAVRHRGASYRWLAGRMGLGPTRIVDMLGKGDDIVERMGWDERDVCRELNLSERTRKARERAERAARGREIVDAWSAPGPPENPAETWSAPAPPKSVLGRDGKSTQ